MTRTSPQNPPPQRIMSIDALRGFDMFWIIGGGDIVRELLNLLWRPMPQYAVRQFEHARWVGFNAWDLIMPLFLFIVGASLPFALSKKLELPAARRLVYIRTAKRFLILFVLGMAVQGRLLQGDLSRVHIYCNTLQAIACGYVVAVVCLMNLNMAGQGAVCAALLAGYWALMFLVPFGGHPAGTLAPHANLALRIDEIILGRFRDGTEYTWILSGMTFAATVLFGVFSGHLLKSALSRGKKFAYLVAAGILCLDAGRVVGVWFPVIKHIWSTSFCLESAGWCYLLLALFYGVVDILNFRGWAFFFVVIGSNALFIYCFAELVAPYVGKIVVHVAETRGMGVAAPLALSAFAAQWFMLYGLYRKKWFLRV